MFSCEMLQTHSTTNCRVTYIISYPKCKLLTQSRKASFYLNDKRSQIFTCYNAYDYTLLPEGQTEISLRTAGYFVLPQGKLRNFWKAQMDSLEERHYTYRNKWL